MRTLPDVDLVAGDDQNEVRLCHAVLVDGGSKQVVLKALKKLTGSELAQEVRGVLDVGRFPVRHVWGVALHLPLYKECVCVVNACGVHVWYV